jgi:hypothetical protein
MITIKTVAPAMMAVRISRRRVGASSRLNHSREPNGSMAGFVAVALLAVMVKTASRHEMAFIRF